MKLTILLCLALLAGTTLFSQTIEFKKSTLQINEPVGDNQEKEDSFDIIMVASEDIKNVKVEVSNSSTHNSKKYAFTPVTKDFKKKENTVKIRITTDAYSDKTTNVIFKISFKDKNGESQLIQDTLFIRNTYPFTAKRIEDYTDWDDAKRADIFIGTNFDFFGENTLTDWHGGIRAFLPAITDLKFGNYTKTKYPRFGIYGGIYHSKSFSRFGNDTNIDTAGVFTRTQGRVMDPAIRFIVARDSLMLHTKNEINNWGAYISPIWQWTRFKSEKFVTNAFVGFHCEVIRRNISTTYSFDTLSSRIDTLLPSQVRAGDKLPPKNFKSIYYDAYFGASFPIQFLWKDILDLRVNPCFGYGSPGDPTTSSSRWFYLFQFDLLATLGGLKLNLGGEIRGYFPTDNPIFSAYIGTAFSVQKLSDFIRK